MRRQATWWVIVSHVLLALVGSAGIWLMNEGFAVGLGQAGSAFWWTPMADWYHAGLGAALVGLWGPVFLELWAWLR